MKSSQCSRVGTRTHLDGLQRHGDNLRSTNTPTFEHPTGAEASRWSPHTSPMLRQHDPEEDHIPHKKSVLTKVKEKAKKLKHSLSGKKKHNEEGNPTPAWGVSLEDDEDQDQDAEYLGAPIYESELAPEGYKVHARQHPRPIPVISEKHVLASSVKCGHRQENEKPPTSNNTVNETAARDKKLTETETLNKKLTETETSNKKLTETETSNKTLTETATPNKTLTETVTEKLAPAYATVSDATYAIASKIQGLAISALATPEIEKHTTLESSKQTNPETVKQATPESDKQTPQETEKQASPSGQVWDKGVSVKEYILNKFEPGEDEKALSKAITDAMSPKGSPREVGVVEKVKEAVSSLLRNEEPSQSSMSNSARSSSPRIPLSINAHEVVEEENHGRVLQAN